MLCLDNCNALIEEDQDEEFLRLLLSLKEQCNNLRIIVPSGLPIHSQEPLTPVILDQMKRRHTVQLFLESCGERVHPKELLQLILKDENFPFKTWLNDIPESEEKLVLTKKQEEKLLNLIEYGDPNRKIKILADHDLFKILQGNPSSIMMIAKIYQVEKYERYQNESRPIDQMTKIRAMSDDLIIDDTLAKIY